MRLSVATRIFVGYAVVLLTFGAVSIFSVAEMHQNQVEIRLVSDGYLPLARDVAAIETFHINQESDTSRMMEGKSVETRRALIRLARVFFPKLMAQKIVEGRDRARRMGELAPAAEASFVRDVEQSFADLQTRYAEYEQAADGIFTMLEAEKPEWDQVTARMDRLKLREVAIKRKIQALHGALESRIEARVRAAQAREKRTGVTIIALSVLAITVGLLATLLSARTLRPVRTLVEGVSRISQGDYTAKVGVPGDDEISVLAREFDAMARSLKEREAQLKQKQEELLRAEQLAAVGRISAQIAHEVRNPLSSIGLNVEMLDEHLARASFAREADRRETHELLSSVTREVDRLTELTDEYLKMARPAQPSLSPESVNDVLVGVLEFSREELQRSGVEVERRLDPSAPRALADEAQLRQVFLNLLRNSREAMADGGRLTIESRRVDDSVEVLFADNGCGIPEGAGGQIFEPFYTTKQGGTGLGLAVSRQILQAHGGSIACESTPGGGTTFVVRLPGA